MPGILFSFKNYELKTEFLKNMTLKFVPSKMKAAV